MSPATTTAETTTTVETTTTAAPDEGAVWIVSLLDRIPDTETSGHEVTLVNLARAADAAGIEPAVEGAPAVEVTAFFADLPADTRLPSLFFRSVTRPDEFRAQLGVDLAAVSSAVEAGTLPAQFLVLEGDFDAAAIDAAARADPVWSDLLAIGEHAGVPYFTWGEDFKTWLERVTTAHPYGRGGRLALDGGYLYLAPWTAGIEALIDAGVGTVPTLADRAPLRQAAEILQREHVYSAVLTDAPLTEGSDASGLALGLGGGRDEAGAFWVVVAIHDTAAGAEESAASFRSIITEGASLGSGEPWQERVASFEVSVAGEAMVAVV